MSPSPPPGNHWALMVVKDGREGREGREGKEIPELYDQKQFQIEQLCYAQIFQTYPPQSHRLSTRLPRNRTWECSTSTEKKVRTTR